MFGRRQESEDTASLFASARATYEQGETQRIGVRFYAIHRGQPAQLAVEDPDGNLCKTYGPVPEPAVYRSLTAAGSRAAAQKRPAARRTSVPVSARRWAPI